MCLLSFPHLFQRTAAIPSQSRCTPALPLPASLVVTCSLLRGAPRPVVLGFRSDAQSGRMKCFFIGMRGVENRVSDGLRHGPACRTGCSLLRRRSPPDVIQHRFKPGIAAERFQVLVGGHGVGVLITTIKGLPESGECLVALALER